MVTCWPLEASDWFMSLKAPLMILVFSALTDSFNATILTTGHQWTSCNIISGNMAFLRRGVSWGFVLFVLTKIAPPPLRCNSTHRFGFQLNQNSLWSTQTWTQSAFQCEFCLMPYAESTEAFYTSSSSRWIPRPGVTQQPSVSRHL